MKKIAATLFALIVVLVGAMYYLTSNHLTYELLSHHVRSRIKAMTASPAEPNDVLFLHIYYLTQQDFEAAIDLTTGEKREVMRQAIDDLRRVYLENDIHERFIRYEPISSSQLSNGNLRVQGRVWIQTNQFGSSRLDRETVTAWMTRVGDEWKIYRLDLNEISTQHIFIP